MRHSDSNALARARLRRQGTRAWWRCLCLGRRKRRRGEKKGREREEERRRGMKVMLKGKHRSEKRSRPFESCPKESKKDSVGRHSSTPKRGEAGASAAVNDPSPPEGSVVVEKERAIEGSSEGAIEVSSLQIVVLSDDAKEMSPVHLAILSPEANQPHSLEVHSPVMLRVDGEEAPALVEGLDEAVADAEVRMEPPVEASAEAEGPPAGGLSPVASGGVVGETEVWVESARDEAMLREEEEEEEEEEPTSERGARSEIPLARAETSEAPQVRVLVEEAKRMAVPQVEVSQVNPLAMNSLIHSPEVEDIFVVLM